MAETCCIPQASPYPRGLSHDRRCVKLFCRRRRCHVRSLGWSVSDQRPCRHTVAVAGIPRVLDIGLVRNVLGHPRRLLDFWVLGIVTAGHIGLEVGDVRVNVGPGDYYLLPRRLVHGGLDNEPFDAAFFHFLPGEQGENGIWELPITGECSPALNYLELLRFLEANFRSGLMSGEELGAQLWAVLGQLAVMQRQKVLLHADPKRVLASEVLEFLHANYSQELSSSSIAAVLGYSYSYLEESSAAASIAVSTRSCGGCGFKVPRMPCKWANRSSTLQRRLVSATITTS